MVDHTRSFKSKGSIVPHAGYKDCKKWGSDGIQAAPIELCADGAWQKIKPTVFICLIASFMV